jgi:hypothetical protein
MGNREGTGRLRVQREGDQCTSELVFSLRLSPGLCFFVERQTLNVGPVSLFNTHTNPHTAGHFWGKV